MQLCLLVVFFWYVLRFLSSRFDHSQFSSHKSFTVFAWELTYSTSTKYQLSIYVRLIECLLDFQCVWYEIHDCFMRGMSRATACTIHDGHTTAAPRSHLDDIYSRSLSHRSLKWNNLNAGYSWMYWAYTSEWMVLVTLCTRLWTIEEQWLRMNSSLAN
jgi:hypothetical protein